MAGQAVGGDDFSQQRVEVLARRGEALGPAFAGDAVKTEPLPPAARAGERRVGRRKCGMGQDRAPAVAKRRELAPIGANAMQENHERGIDGAPQRQIAAIERIARMIRPVNRATPSQGAARKSRFDGQADLDASLPTPAF